MRKVSSAGAGGAVGIVVSAILTGIGVDVSAELAGAISTICAFGLSYMIPNKTGD